MVFYFKNNILPTAAVLMNSNTVQYRAFIVYVTSSDMCEGNDIVYMQSFRMLLDLDTEHLCHSKCDLCWSS